MTNKGSRKLPVTQVPIEYKASPYGKITTIPAGTPCRLATNLPGEPTGEPRYWALPWAGMGDRERAWYRNHGFLLTVEDMRGSAAETFVVWIYNDNCVLAGRPWLPPENESPIFKGVEHSEEETMKDLFGSDFPSGDLHAVEGSEAEIEGRFWPDEGAEEGGQNE